MINKDNCYFLGEIFKTHGLNGAVSVKLDTDSPEQYKKLELTFLEFNKKLVPFFIDSIRITNQDNAIIKFWDFDSEIKSKQLVGVKIFLPLESLPILNDDQFYYHELEGYNVVDEIHGELGKAKEVIEYPSHEVLQVFNKENKEILIPISDDIITNIDKKAKTITVKLPEGLLDVYINN